MAGRPRAPNLPDPDPPRPVRRRRWRWGWVLTRDPRESLRHLDAPHGDVHRDPDPEAPGVAWGSVDDDDDHHDHLEPRAGEVRTLRRRPVPVLPPAVAKLHQEPVALAELEPLEEQARVHPLLKCVPDLPQ